MERVQSSPQREQSTMLPPLPPYSTRASSSEPTPSTHILHTPRGTSTPEMSPSTRAEPKKSVSVEFWIGEILSIGFALAALASIVCLLAARKDKPLPDWPSMLQINSLIAILSSLFKVVLLFPITEGISELKWLWYAIPRPVSDFDCFDSASRGPFGALKLIAKHPSNLVTSFGAAIIILALAIDPFTQQIAQFYSCPLEIGTILAHVPRTNNFTGGSVSPIRSLSKARLQMSAALYQGLLNPPVNASAAVDIYCASGNCTFPHANGVAYSSLALCSSVQDISNTVIENTTYASLNSTKPLEKRQFRLPSGLNLSMISPLGPDPFGVNSMQVTVTGMVIPRLNGQHPNANRSMFEFEILSLKADCSALEALRPRANCLFEPTAVQFSLTPCVHVYGNVSVSNSVFEERVESTSLLQNTENGYTLAGNHSSFVGVDCEASARPRGNKKVPATLSTAIPGSDNETVRCVGASCASRIKFYHGNVDDIVYYDPACVFTFAEATSSDLGHGLLEIFGATDNPRHFTKSLTTAPIVFAPGENWLERLSTNGHVNVSSVTTFMDGLTNALNAVIRQNGDKSNSVPARGATVINQTCVGVAWAWISYPAALTVLTTLFLGITIVRSQSSARASDGEGMRRPWKSSSLPLLWCGIQDTTRARYGRFEGFQHMKDYSEKTWVSLETEEKQGRLVLMEAER